jgi:hypothetical protein
LNQAKIKKAGKGTADLRAKLNRVELDKGIFGGKILGECVKDLRDLAQLRHLLGDLTQLNKEFRDPESDGGRPSFNWL